MASNKIDFVINNLAYNILVNSKLPNFRKKI